ncbi:MAG: pirin family protein [Deltaproteobacteria bacterium]|nr:pirin family protein [Deltaproteobacteria bacterium]
MRILRRSAERFHTEISWLNSRHTFSFGHHFDPKWRGFGTLLVLNDDVVAPQGGFATHGHRDMEIVSYVVEGALAHKDSMGNGTTIRRGEVQRMSAGTGVRHSEYNATPGGSVRFLQLWFPPTTLGLQPSYAQASIDENARRGRFALLAGPEGEGGVVSMHADARLYGAILADDEVTTFDVPQGRGVWVQVVTGHVALDGEDLDEGDGVGVLLEPGEPTTLRLAGTRGGAEVLIFDVAG